VVEANVAEENKLLLEKGFSQGEITSRMQRFCMEWHHGRD
jgi:translation initiation factor 2 beta subunit (eIF-2beta)/eIF-5